jgi:RNA polymerase sigma-70 factor (ECF subfamily)
MAVFFSPASASSCPAQAGHPVTQVDLVFTGSPAFADGKFMSAFVRATKPTRGRASSANCGGAVLTCVNVGAGSEASIERAQDESMSESTPDFDVIYTEFRPKVLRYLNGMIGANEAEDVAQNVFLKVHAGLEDFRGEASLSTWIYRIATNAALDRLRNRSFGRVVDTDVPNAHDSAVAEVAGESAEPSAESTFIRTEMNECIRTYIDALSEKYRTVLVLSDFEGFKDREIAEILGLSVEAVKVRLHRARLELKKRFQTGCDFYRTDENELACDRKEPAGR